MEHTRHRVMAETFCAFALVGALLALGGCATPGGTGDAAGQEQSGGQIAEAVADDVDQAVEDIASQEFASECLDRRGDVSAFAVLTLDGPRLEVFLEQQGYAWNERNQLWAKDDGSSAVEALDATGNPLSREQMVQLGVGSVQPDASYRIVTSNYSSVKRAFNGVVGKVMTCDDVEFVDECAVGIAVCPDQTRCLAFATTSEDVHVVTLMGEQAVKAGLFDQLAGQELGTSIDEVFEALTGRPANDGAADAGA